MEKLTSQDVLKLLKKIEEVTSDEKLASISYQLRALLPECDDTMTLVSIYSQLMQSQEYYQVALSIVTFVVQDVCSIDQLNILQGYVQQHTKYESDNLILPKLHLRVHLTNVAANITDENQFEALINRFARVQLEAHPDRFKALSPLCTMLKLFERLEREGEFGTLGEKEKANLNGLQDILKDIGRRDLAEDIISFSSLRPFTCAVMDVGKFPNEMCVFYQHIAICSSLF